MNNTTHTLPTVKLHNMDTKIAAFNGKYSLCSSRGMMLSDANDLIEQAAKIVGEYAQFVGFGDTREACRKWLIQAAEYAMLRETHFTTGNDYRA